MVLWVILNKNFLVTKIEKCFDINKKEMKNKLTIS